MEEMEKWRNNKSRNEMDKYNEKTIERRGKIFNSKKQLDSNYYCIVLLIGSTCFGYYYTHHQEITTVMLISTFVVSFLGYCMLEVR